MLRVGLLVVGLLLLASPAFAQALPPDPAQLDYTRPKNLVACPEEWYFRAFVAGRFGGVDPFTPDAPRRIALTLGRKPGAFVATLDMYDSAGAYLGGNEKPLVGPDCQRIVDHAGGIVVAWLMPIVVPRRTPPTEPPQAEPAPVVPQPPPAEPAAAKPEAAPAPPPPHAALVAPESARKHTLPVAVAAFGLAGTFLALGIGWTVDAQNKENAARARVAQVDPPGDASGSACTAGTVSTINCAQIAAAFQSRDTSIGFRNTWYSLAGVSIAVGVAAVVWPVVLPEGRTMQVGIGPGSVALRSSF